MQKIKIKTGHIFTTFLINGTACIDFIEEHFLEGSKRLETVYF